MEKTTVIAMRNSLLQENGKNKSSMRIVFDNGVNLVLGSDMVLWDDTKEIVVGIVADHDSGSFESGKPIRIISSTYEYIQFIMCNTNVENLESMLDSISESMTVSDENKKKILEYFGKLYDYRYELSHKNYNPIDIIRD